MHKICPLSKNKPVNGLLAKYGLYSPNIIAYMKIFLIGSTPISVEED